MEERANIRKAAALLYRLGVTPNYNGFYQTAYMVHLAIDQPDRLLYITKQLYPETAKHCGTTAAAIDRNVRTVIRVVWATEPFFLSSLAGRFLKARPRPAQFISILAHAISGFV